MKRRALLLFSEGLDSILAGKILQEQGIEIIALRFITPFFGWQWKGKEEAFDRYVQEEFGFEKGLIVDLSAEFLKMLAQPKHGYGSGFNPCVDCKILMLKKAKKLMPVLGAHFLVTGEVVGQRPMSQQRNTLRHIEKEAGVEDVLLRPLSAKKLKPSRVEEMGLVDRERLLDISGRGRKKQLSLAQALGLKKIPSPAGGCLLTDPALAPRFERFFALKGGEVTPKEAEILTFGRHFELPGGSWLVIGRNQAENARLQALVGDRTILKLSQIPGPTGALLIEKGEQDLQEAASLIKRYAPKARNLEKVAIRVIRKGKEEIIWA